MALTKAEIAAIKSLVWDLETAVTGIHEMRRHDGPLLLCESPLCKSLLKSEGHPFIAAIMAA